MLKTRLIAVALILISIAVGYFVYTTEPMAGEKGGRFAFHLGLDLRPGSHLVYKADTSTVAEGTDIPEALDTLRDVIERRVNLFGVAEPLVQVDRGGVFGQGDYRLIVELPGVTDVSQAVKMIGETPLLEFRLVKSGQEALIRNADGTPNLDAFEPATLTGKNLKRAVVEFTQGGAGGLSGEPTVRVDFDDQGAAEFERLTGENTGRFMGIFLDGELVSAPIIRERISGGTAIISGGFAAEEAKALAKNLNFGALPVPIELESTQSIGATLGERALNAGVFAGIVGLSLVALFMLLWYRLPGLVAVVALGTYVALMLAFFKLIPVTLTAAGIAGFILSIGLAVDANVLIFERMKEELRAGKRPEEAIREGFARAWTSIFDSNVVHIIAGVILFWFGTSLVQGFALVLVMGVLVSMLSAITVSRTFLLALGMKGGSSFSRFLIGTGFSR